MDDIEFRAFRDAIVDELTAAKLRADEAVKDADRAVEDVSKFMIRNGFATGHGDCMDDLLREFEWQLDEKLELGLNVALRKAGQVEECKKGLNAIVGHAGLTMLNPDETASSEARTAYCEGVVAAYESMAALAKAALIRAGQ